MESNPSVDFVVVGGDFNTDTNRSSYHTRRLKSFCDEEDLLICNDELLKQSDFTFQSSSGHHSVIDHFLLSLNFTDLPSIYSAVRYDGDNLSDYNALTFRAFLSVCRSGNPPSGRVINYDPHTVWRKASSDDLLNYRCCLELALQSTKLPYSCTSCTSDVCYELISQYYESIAHACISTAKVCIPQSSRLQKRPIAGWSEEVKPYKKRSIFWHRLWKSNGCPRQGEVYKIMKRARAQYKRISPRVVRSQDSIRMGRMADGVLAGRGRNFWDEVRLITRAKISPPSFVEGANTEEGINDVFTSKYRDLHNSVPYDVLTMDRFLRDINGRVRSGCSDYCAALHDITPAEVTAAIKKLRPHKGDAKYELSSNHLIHGGPALYKCLAHLFNLMLFCQQ
ncbi:hypothetical protein CAPTEDRAFT_197472 [Capitella teleta]|uniref:Endonuclease/exonuclease/phosphatase domain-containing protein n=1 Tax=Capitella teleta TaxID=283909 RepID=R7TFY5_CAPTE|nr:hypothetical protein CAPTEDRAFT_197472 [Capitella teleta]|eukprot:ELT90451.1 hypothetical protein CAPTEDRAFT_197472 [Capitella teleta]